MSPFQVMEKLLLEPDAPPTSLVLLLNTVLLLQEILTVNSSSTSNFRFFGPSNLDADVSSGNTSLYVPQNPLSIVNGTLQLTGSIDIPVLEVNDNTSGNGY